MVLKPALRALYLAHRIAADGVRIQRGELAVPRGLEALLDHCLRLRAAAEGYVATRDRGGDRGVALLGIGDFLPRLVERARVVRLALQAFGEGVSAQLRALVGVEDVAALELAR